MEKKLVSLKNWLKKNNISTATVPTEKNMHFMLKIARKYYTPNSTKSNETKRTMEEKKKYSHNKRHSYECVVSEFCVLCFLTASLFSLTFVCRTGVVHALHMHSTMMMIRSAHTRTHRKWALVFKRNDTTYVSMLCHVFYPHIERETWCLC